VTAKTLWLELTPEERGHWMREQPAAASASRDGKEKAPVSLGRVDMPARCKVVLLPETIAAKKGRK
jgi:hypothetical protein